MSQLSIHDKIMSRKNDEVTSVPASASPRNWWKTLSLSLLGVAIIGVGSYGAVHYDAFGSFLQPAVADAAQGKSSATDTPFQQHAKQAGLASCSNVFPGLGALLTSGSQYGVQSIWNDDAPDKHSIQALVGMNYATAGYSGPAAGVVLASPTATDCEGSMVRVAPFDISCSDMPGKLPKGSKLTNNLSQVSVYELPDNNGNAMLLPVGDRCVVISVASATGAKGEKR